MAAQAPGCVAHLKQLMDVPSIPVCICTQSMENEASDHTFKIQALQDQLVTAQATIASQRQDLRQVVK